MSPITTHILDTHRGCPAQGVPIQLFRRQGNEDVLLSEGKTNDDGRIRDLLPAGSLIPGIYTMRFDTGAYHESLGIVGFYPEALVVFEIQSTTEHYHIPLLLSPFAYSTYRGS
jgi:5-hydroxyisourate hydrolase